MAAEHPAGQGSNGPWRLQKELSTEVECGLVDQLSLFDLFFHLASCRRSLSPAMALGIQGHTRKTSEVTSLPIASWET